MEEKKAPVKKPKRRICKRCGKKILNSNWWYCAMCHKAIQRRSVEI